MLPYTLWETRKVADPRKATYPQMLDGMGEILDGQGPMQALHLFQTYAKAGGLLKITSSVRKRMEGHLRFAVEQGELVMEKENDTEVKSDTDSRCWIIRKPNQARVMMRELGPRNFSEIPMTELAALILELRVKDEFIGREEIARSVLAHYDLQKLTSLVQRRLKRVMEEYF